MKPINTLSTLRYLQNKIRLIRAIHLYKLKFEELSKEEERSTRLELSDFDLIQEEFEEHIFTLQAILKILKEDKTKEETQKVIKDLLRQLPAITKEMYQFVKALHQHGLNIQKWLKIITPEIPQKNIHLYSRSTATAHDSSTASTQANNKRESSKESEEEITNGFSQYAQTLQLLKSAKQNLQFSFSIENLV
jgi:hypothetical protein